MATAIKKNTNSSTSAQVVQEHQNCTGCTQYVHTQSGSGREQPTDILALVNYMAQLGTLQSEVNTLRAELEAEKSKSAGFYKSFTKLSNITQKAIWILLIIPMLQLVACAVIVYHLGIQDNIPSLLNWVLGGVSLLSVAEMIILPIKFTTMENRMNEIERKLSENHNTV